ncbi:hypothetical protein MK852_17850 [Shewanella benthica]|uniref:hypothetical protein n=1 Tax=Shewanella benthica TaxID=43661 RepID=UPI001D0D50A1|nr:hypothetical protein [Shewanella benthica]MCL1063981.1 hypothetical protein [Shewanella benthica]
MTQNSGILNLLLNQQSAQAMSATLLPAYVSAESNVSASAKELAQGAELKAFEFKKCELSEKSMRVCMDAPSSLPFLVLLFLLPLLPLVYRVITRSPEPGEQAQPRRIHLSLCRFQE